MEAFTKYIQNEEHYEEVLMRVNAVKKTLWIATADIKDLYIKDRTKAVSFLELLARLIDRNVEVRLLHGREPGPMFRKDFDKFPQLIKNMERAICPRVHFKLLIYDLSSVYIGSANLTGAGLGMKGVNRRNFETGILSNENTLVESAINQFDQVWRGARCQKCDRKDYCGDRLDR